MGDGAPPRSGFAGRTDDRDVVAARDCDVDHLRGRAVRRCRRQGLMRHLGRAYGVGAIVAGVQAAGLRDAAFFKGERGVVSRDSRRRQHR